MKKFFLVVVILVIFWPASVYAATTSGTSPEILRSAQNDKGLDQINQKVSDRFEEDMVKLAAIMEELRRRKGIQETRVAFGGVDTKIKSADYQVTYAAEALAYQRAKKFSSKAQLRSSLETLKNKILGAKAKVGSALNE